MQRWTAVFLCWLLCLNGQVTYCADHSTKGRSVSLRWNELANYLAQGETEIILADGATVRGRTLSASADELVLEVSKSSNKRAYAKGRRAFPRAQVKSIQLSQVKGSGGRIALTAAGIFAGLGAGAVVALSQAESSGNAAAGVGVIGLIVGLGVGGYYAGKSIDQKKTTVVLLPD